MNSGKGFIALISVIIISAILLIITFSAGFTNFFARFNVLDNEYKKISVGLAEACLETAKVELGQDEDWTPITPDVNLGSGKSCKICEVSGTTQKTVYTRAVYEKSYTNLVAEITPLGLATTLDSWQEEAIYSGTSCPIP